MVTINNRDELKNFPYGTEKEYSTLVGIARIGGELLAEALRNYNTIECFFYAGDEGEYITVDSVGNVVNDFIYN